MYYCRTDRVEALADRLVRFTSALGESIQLLNSVTVAEFRPLLAAYWPTMPAQVLESSCERMLHSPTWATPHIDQLATERWMRILFEEKMVRRGFGLIHRGACPETLRDHRSAGP